MINSPDATAAATTERRILWFTGAIFAVSLLLQRFGVPFGGKQLSIVGPIGFALVGYGVYNGTLVFHRGRLITYLALLACVLIGYGWHDAVPSDFGATVNLNSLAQFLILTTFATLTFARPVQEIAFFKVVNNAFMVVAVLGILQFAAQFAGIRVFSFTGLLPPSILYEAGYNLEIQVGIGEILKSNGLLLVEPSVFSQMMALALIIEAIGMRRVLFLAAFAAGLVLSFAGTGWLVIAAFLVGSTVAMGRKGMVIAAAVGLALATILVVAQVFAPDFLDSFTGRYSEFSTPGTSGHQRFVTPFWLLHDVLSVDPAAALLGIGSGASEILTLPYDYFVTTPIKVLVEYGAPALIAYVTLFVQGRKTALQAALVFPGLILFFFTGGYQQFPPILFIVLMLTSVARLDRSTYPRARAAVTSGAVGAGRAVAAAR